MEGLAATLDLGSNSFHLLLAEWHSTGWRPHLRLGENVRLASGSDASGLSVAAMERGWECLGRFAPHIQDLAPERVRIVGTQALRAAANRDLFIARAQRILGHSVSVISGLDEARLIYLAAVAGRSEKRRLVADVGGASTELVSGCGDRIEALASVPVGCLTLRDYFRNGRLDASSLEGATRLASDAFAARWSLPPADRPVLGCSGTLQAIGEVLARAGLAENGIERAGLAALKSTLLGFSHIDEVYFDGLCDRRRHVFAAGIALATALFDVLGIERMALSACALREGLMEQLHREAIVRQPLAEASRHALAQPG